MSGRDQMVWSRLLTRPRALLWAIVAVAGALVLFLLQSGYASNLNVTTIKLGAGSAGVAVCDPDGLSFRYTSNNAGQVTQVSVTDIHAACAGGTLKVTLSNGSASVGTGSVSLPASGFTGTASVSLSPQPAATVITAARAAIEGP